MLLGACFVASGWLKGVDPYGTSLKLSEYFRVWGWSGFVADHPLAWSVCLCAGELCMGLLLLSGVFRKAVAWGAVAAMSAFTALAAWLAFSPMGMSVQDCGCFGEAFTLGHGATLLKNIMLWALSVWHLWVVRTESCHGLKGWCTAACWQFPSTRRSGFPRWISCLSAVGRLCLPCRVSGCMTEGMKR
mgnify:CR=1 FL=1